MKKALISPNEQVSNIIAWELNPSWDGINPKTKYLPVFETIPNAARICEISEQAFPISEPFFWVDCADDVEPNEYYYDTQTQTINLIVNVPYPT